MSSAIGNGENFSKFSAVCELNVVLEKSLRVFEILARPVV
jgi:hypothetical protein